MRVIVNSSHPLHISSRLLFTLRQQSEEYMPPKQFCILFIICSYYMLIMKTARSDWSQNSRTWWKRKIYFVWIYIQQCSNFCKVYKHQRYVKKENSLSIANIFMGNTYFRISWFRTCSKFVSIHGRIERLYRVHTIV